MRKKVEIHYHLDFVNASRLLKQVLKDNLMA